MHLQGAVKSTGSKLNFPIYRWQFLGPISYLLANQFVKHAWKRQRWNTTTDHHFDSDVVIGRSFFCRLHWPSPMAQCSSVGGKHSVRAVLVRIFSSDNQENPELPSKSSKSIQLSLSKSVGFSTEGRCGQRTGWEREVAWLSLFQGAGRGALEMTQKVGLFDIEIHFRDEWVDTLDEFACMYMYIYIYIIYIYVYVYTYLHIWLLLAQRHSLMHSYLPMVPSCRSRNLRSAWEDHDPWPKVDGAINCSCRCTADIAIYSYI